MGGRLVLNLRQLALILAGLLITVTGVFLTSKPLVTAGIAIIGATYLWGVCALTKESK